MGLNETLERLARERYADLKAEEQTESQAEPTTVCNIPRLDEWELNLTLAAIRQYMRLNLQPFAGDTVRQKKRKKYNKNKLASAINKIRAARKSDKTIGDEDTEEGGM